MRPPISTGDLIRAFRVLRPDSVGERHAVAQALGFAMPLDAVDGFEPPEPSPEPNPEPYKRGPVPDDPVVPEKPPAPPVVSVTPGKDAPSAAIRGPFPSTLDQAPWLNTPLEFEPPPERRSQSSPPVATLFSPQGTRAILTTALAIRAPVGRINVAQIVDQVARGKPLLALPRQPGHVIAPWVDVLVDIGETMLPFADDQKNLIPPLRSVVRAEHVRKLRFRGSPHRVAGMNTPRTWGPYRVPPSGTHVLLLTDFGIGQQPFEAGLPEVNSWRQFAAELRRHGVECTAFVPYPPKRWPAEARRLFNLVQWDRKTTAGSVKFGRRHTSP